MQYTEIVVQGTLNSDGTLQLDEKPELTPGRVTVVLRQPKPTPEVHEGWWPAMQRIRAKREAAGYPFLDEAGMQSHLDWLRDDEERIDGIWREVEQAKRKEGTS